MHGWDDANTRTSWAMRCVQGVSVATETEQGLRRLTLRAHSRVHQVCHVIVGFHVICVDLCFSRCHWCRTSHRSAGRFYMSTSFHHAYAIPSVKFFSSGCCSLTSSCHRPLNQYRKFLHISHHENGCSQELSLHLPSVTVDRRQL